MASIEQIKPGDATHLHAQYAVFSPMWWVDVRWTGLRAKERRLIHNARLPSGRVLLGRSPGVILTLARFSSLGIRHLVLIVRGIRIVDWCSLAAYALPRHLKFIHARSFSGRPAGDVLSDRMHCANAVLGQAADPVVLTDKSVESFQSDDHRVLTHCN
ncbi:hypothetical protein M0D45_00230 [Xanthomonas prunicola]|uniref:hypothetical protein n=1 Tax=Xanthomonas prunicola TaxID=2053930 RepID=UPI0021B437E2|nr:hypothetical protein [Xanthomonas prunicola]UXA53276.1 hypothetical protein M0D45_00230 [Xanthomonas prunicola]